MIETDVSGKVVKKSNHHSDVDGSSPILCCERWFLDLNSSPVIFFSVCWRQCVAASWLAILQGCWLACLLAGCADSRL